MNVNKLPLVFAVYYDTFFYPSPNNRVTKREGKKKKKQNKNEKEDVTPTLISRCPLLHHHRHSLRAPLLRTLSSRCYPRRQLARTRFR